MAKYTHAQYEKKVRNWTRGIPLDVEAALRVGGEIVLGEVIRNHLSGPKMPKGIGSDKYATLQPQTGRLKNSVHETVRRSHNKISLFVGTNVIYAASHEKGDPPRGIPRRPYLEPSRDKKLPEVKQAISDRLVGSYHRAR